MLYPHFFLCHNMWWHLFFSYHTGMQIFFTTIIQPNLHLPHSNPPHHHHHHQISHHLPLHFLICHHCHHHRRIHPNHQFHHHPNHHHHHHLFSCLNMYLKLVHFLLNQQRQRHNVLYIVFHNYHK